MTLSAANSHRLSNISFLCACVVVLVHVPWPRETVWQQYLASGLRNSLAELVIPLFSTIAGFLLAGRVGEPDWWRKAVLKRVRTLLIPYVVWMSVAVVLFWLCSGVRQIGFANSGLNLFRQPLVVPLWFLRALFLLVLASPLIHAGLVRWGWRLLFVEYVAAFAVTMMLGLGYWSETEGWGCLFNNGLPLEGLLYFSLGLWLRIRRPICIGQKTALASFLLALLAVVVQVLLHHYGISCPVNVSYLVAPLFLIGIWYMTPTMAWPRFLVGTSFAIYVVHAIVLGVIWLIPSLRRTCPFGLTVLLGIVIPIVLANLLSLFAPRVARILFGGRT